MTRMGIICSDFIASPPLDVDQTFIHRVTGDIMNKNYHMIIFNYEVTGDIVVEVWASSKSFTASYVLTIDRDNTLSYTYDIHNFHPPTQEDIDCIINSEMFNATKHLSESFSFPITDEFMFHILTLNMPDEFGKLQVRKKLAKFGI